MHVKWKSNVWWFADPNRDGLVLDHVLSLTVRWIKLLRNIQVPTQAVAAKSVWLTISQILTIRRFFGLIAND